MKNYCQVLGLEESATLDEIKAAYRTYAKNFHPDKQNGNEFFKERFQEIQEAYEYLCQNHDKNIGVEKHEDSANPNDSDVYEQEDENIAEDEQSYINDKYYIKLQRKKERINWLVYFNCILFGLLWISMCIYFFPDAMPEKSDIVKWLDMTGTWLEPAIAFIKWIAITLLVGIMFSYILPLLIWGIFINRIESKITEYSNRLELNPYLNNEIWKEILRNDYYYQGLCHAFNKIKRKQVWFWVTWIGIEFIILCFTWIPFMKWAEGGWLAIFALLGYPIILGFSIIGILYLFKIRPTYNQYYTLQIEIANYKNELINTYKPENY